MSRLSAPLRRITLPLAFVLTAGWVVAVPMRTAPGAEATSATQLASGEAAALIRTWFMGESVASAASSKPSAEAENIDQYRRYVKALEGTTPEQRERDLRRLYNQTDSTLLRSLILHTVSQDPTYRSRQALFIRRYGFYANWFNRLCFTAGRVIQGNLQSTLQLGIDAVNDIFRPSEADPYERRAYDLLRRGAPAPDSERLSELESSVNRALAQDDFEHARWILHNGDPEAATFYARQAEARRPGWGKAARLRERAEAETARRRLAAVASTQVGYPDRQPPFDPATPDLLRAILAGGEIGSTRPDETLIAEIMKELPRPQSGHAAMMRDWSEQIANHPETPENQQRWLRAMIDDQEHNLDLRLLRAREMRRGQLSRFIFLGPEKGREKAYKVASGAAQTYQAIGNLGILYIFEVLGRGIQAVFRPPSPDDEVLDALALWLRASPDRTNPEARHLADDLADEYKRLHRFSCARRVLEAGGDLTAQRKADLNRGEARWLLAQAEALPETADRRPYIERAKELSPGPKLVKRADKLDKKTRRAKPREIHADWATVRQWSGRPLPHGLPGKPEWFDGKLSNGEAGTEGLTIAEQKETDKLLISYAVRFPGERRVQSSQMSREELTPELRRWVGLTFEQQWEASQSIHQLDHLPIPFEFEGGAGPSGVDFYPRLLPIQTVPGEIELYR